jgi:alpha-L-rhamnosidase
MNSKKMSVDLTGSSWLWLTPEENSRNCYIRFRKTFSLPQKPKVAEFRISAFAFYRLFVNGREIGFGPNPAPVEHYYFDSYEVAPYLRKGNNLIAVLAYNFGDSGSFDTTYAIGIGGGFFFSGDIIMSDAAKLRVASDESWKAAKSEAWESDTPKYSELRVGFKEYVDGRRDILDFIKPEYDDHDWNNADILQDFPLKTLFRREIKYFQFEPRFPVNAFSIGYNTAYGFSADRGWEIDDPMALVGGYPKGTHLKMLRGGEGANLHTEQLQENLLENECVVTVIRPEEPPSLLLDFGRLCVGRLEIKLANAPEAGRIDIAYGESLNLTYIDRYITRKGDQVFSPYHRRVGRYVMLTFRDFTSAVQLQEVVFKHMTYPAKLKGGFNSSDSLLDRIWEVGKNSLQLSMYDHYEDCPWREQKLYSGDMHIQALTASYLFKDYEYTAKCIRQLAELRRADNWLPHAGPGHCMDDRIIDFPARFIITLRNYVLNSGDLKLLRKLYPRVIDQISAYRSMPHQHGLIDIGYENSLKNWCFINWGKVDKQGVSAPFNFLVIQALDAAVELAGYAGQAVDAEEMRTAAANYRKVAEARFWNLQQQLYSDAVVHDKLSDYCSLETNTLALLTGCGNGQRKTTVLKKIESSSSLWLTKSPFFNYFVVDMLFRCGKAKTALKIIREYWGDMVIRGADTFWETHDHETPPGAMPHKLWSLCHGWSSGPVPLLGRWILGVKPLSPGFAEVEIHPRPLDLQKVSGKVPTPHGDISVKWNCTGQKMSIRTPGFCKVKLDLRNCRKFKTITLNGISV